MSTNSSESSPTEPPKKSPRQLRREKEAAANREAWAPMQAELHARRAAMRVMGGPERVRKYMHDRGKLDARQRLDALFDPGTFREIGPLVGTVSNVPAEGFICGIGQVNSALFGADVAHQNRPLTGRDRQLRLARPIRRARRSVGVRPGSATSLRRVMA